MNALAFHPNDQINRAIIFATEAHGRQVRKGTENFPYVFHCFSVAQEIILYSGLHGDELRKAIIVAILHDVYEDTLVSLEEIKRVFSKEIADGVSAMSKDPMIKGIGDSKVSALAENLERILAMPPWLQCVKLADRINNLEVFPRMWSKAKIAQYLIESVMIVDALGHASEGLQARLLSNIHKMRLLLDIRSSKV